MSKESNIGSRLMKAVEAISLSPEDARKMVHDYRNQIILHDKNLSDSQVMDAVLKKIANRYKKMSALIGGSTSLAGIIPGIGTAISLVGGGLADVSACMKLQIDMTMCMAIAINDQITDEDAKRISMIIALTGTVEKFGKKTFSERFKKATLKIIKENIKGSSLKIIKELFQRVGVDFTKKSLFKVIPFGVGVVVSSGFNYALTAFIAKTARETLLAEFKSN